MRHLILGIILGVLFTAAPSGAGKDSIFDNRQDIERQNADQERHQQQIFREEQRQKKPC